MNHSNNSRKLLFAILIIFSIVGVSCQPDSLNKPVALGILDEHNAAKIPGTFGKLPLSFIPNAGQTDPSVQFQAQGLGGSLFFTPGEVVLELPTPAATSTPGFGLEAIATGNPSPVSQARNRNVLRVRFEEANARPGMLGADRMSSIVNYLIGNDPASWHTKLPTYAGILYRQLYPGVDLRYNGNDGVLKGSYIVSPGADPSRIRWRYDGAASVRLDEGTGNLLIAIGEATLIEHAPVAWQEINGQRMPVAIHYTLADDSNISFALGTYDLTRPLTIDPTLTYSTYLGGNDVDAGKGIAVDAAGNAYVVGITRSTNFPTANALQPTLGGDGDAFVAKLNSTGSSFVYSTYIGGGGDDVGTAICVDSAGNAYVTGETRSANFPTANALQPTIGGSGDGFVAKLNPTGSALVYSTYLGGSSGDRGYGIAVDPSGNAYVTGETSSTNFPTANPLQPTIGGNGDAFVAKLNPTGSALVYSTYLGGSYGDRGYGIAVDPSGNTYVTGSTNSTDFPTANPLQPAFGGGDFDAFVAKLNPGGSALVYSTYLGGSDVEPGYEAYPYISLHGSITVDTSGNAYVTGGTTSTDFPTVNALQPAYNGGGGDAFVTKFNPSGSALIYSTYLGGSATDWSHGIAVDLSRNIYVTGGAFSTDFPTVDALQPTNGGGYDVFVTRFNPSGSALIFSTYLGGSGDDAGWGIAVDAAGNDYVTGPTYSADFPTANALQPAFGGGTDDAFVAKISSYAFKNFLPLVLRNR